MHLIDFIIKKAVEGVPAWSNVKCVLQHVMVRLVSSKFFRVTPIL